MPSYGDCRIEVSALGFSAVQVARLGDTQSIPYEITLRPTATIIISGLETGESITMSCSKGALFANTDGGLSNLQLTFGADRPSFAMTSLKNTRVSYKSHGRDIVVAGVRYPCEIEVTFESERSTGDFKPTILKIARAETYTLDAKKAAADTNSHQVTLVILDESKKPIAGAHVMVLRKDKTRGNRAFRADAKGQAKLSVANGKNFKVLIQAPDFKRQEFEIKDTFGGMAAMELILGRTEKN